MAPLWLFVGLALLALILFALLFWQRQRTRLSESPADSSIIDADLQKADDGTTTAVPREQGRRVPARSLPWLVALALALLVGLGFWLLPNLFASRRADQFVVLVAPFRDTGGDVGQTGRVVAQSLADLLAQQTSANGTKLVVETVSDAPANADAAYLLATTREADVVVWGEVSPGGVLDQESLLPSIAYAPNGAYAPNVWDGYTGRFAMPRAFVLANAPINGQVVLPGLIVALDDYASDNADVAFDRLSKLATDYPALAPALPNAFAGNVLWARGAYDQAADVYRRALSVPAADGARLANNLGAILLDAGDSQALNAFDQSLTLLNHGEGDMGALRYNLGLLALDQRSAGEATDGLTAAKGLLPPNAALLLTLARAQREAGKFDDATATLKTAEQQIDSDINQVPRALSGTMRDALRAKLLDERGTLALAQLADGNGPLAWELEALPIQSPDRVKPARTTLESAIVASDTVAATWRSRETADAARNHSGASMIDNGQAKRTQSNTNDMQLRLAMAQIEESRADQTRSRSFLSRLMSGLLGDSTALTGVQGRLAQWVKDNPDNTPALIQLARVLRLRNQFADANQRYDSVIAATPSRPEGYGGKGQVALDQGRQDEAKGLFAQALDRDATYFPARRALAQIAENQGDWNGAIAQFDWLATNRPRSQDGVLLAQALRRSGASNYPRAEQVLLPLTAAGNVDALIELGRLYNDAGKPDQARSSYENALKRNSRSSPAAFELGQTLEKQGDIAGAQQRLQQAIDSDPTNVDARVELAQLYDGPLNQPSQADELYRSVIQQGVNDPDKLARMGDALLLHNDPDDASKAYLQALQQRPDNPQLHHKLAQAYLMMNNLDGARSSEQHALALTNNAFPEALIGMGDIEQRSGHLDRAADLYTQALAQDGGQVPALLGLGQVTAAQGNWSVALNQFQQAATRAPNDPMAQFWTGEALLRQPNIPAAMDAYNRAIALKPAFPEAYLGLAQAQLAADTDRASALNAASVSVAQAIKLKSKYAEALLFQGKIQQEQGQTSQALRSYNDAISANSSLAEPYFRRGLIYVQQSNYSQADDDLQRAISRQNNFPEAHYWLGRTYYAQGKMPAALTEFKTAVSLQGDSYAEARLYQGLVEEQMGDREAASQSFQSVIQSDGGSPWAATAQQELSQQRQ